ncbi:MAG: glucose-6-phosphate dehydrogenase, partial [Thermoplasmata archaeon]
TPPTGAPPTPPLRGRRTTARTRPSTIEPHLFVVFGGTGDLVARKLLPALWELFPVSSAAPTAAHVLALGRHGMGEPAYRDWARRALQSSVAAPPAVLRRWTEARLSYETLGGQAPEDFRRLSDRIVAVEKANRLPGNRIFYLALPAPAFGPVLSGLGAAGLARGPGWCRLVLEKPFGHNLASARELNLRIHRHFEESQVFRIDHDLGKETVQNLIVFRFANMLFESVWNRDRVEHVEITVAEDLGVEHRAGYYDQTGALRDMVQSHLMQLLMLTAMEVPASLDADEVRNEKVKVLRAIRPLQSGAAVFGQYGPGRRNGRPVPGYTSEEGIPRGSRTETFVALRLAVDTWRWHGVPFFLSTGKRLAGKLTEIVVRFREPPVWFFPNRDSPWIRANTLTISIQPKEGFELAIEIKRPGPDIRLVTQRLHFRYDEVFGPLEDAYPALLRDVVEGDPSLFVRADEVEESWRVLDSLIDHPPALTRYPSGSWGPSEANRLLSRNGHKWATP